MITGFWRAEIISASIVVVAVCHRVITILANTSFWLTIIGCTFVFIGTFFLCKWTFASWQIAFISCATIVIIAIFVAIATAINWFMPTFAIFTRIFCADVMIVTIWIWRAFRFRRWFRCWSNCSCCCSCCLCCRLCCCLCRDRCRRRRWQWFWRINGVDSNKIFVSSVRQWGFGPSSAFERIAKCL